MKKSLLLSAFLFLGSSAFAQVTPSSETNIKTKGQVEKEKSQKADKKKAVKKNDDKSEKETKVESKAEIESGSIYYDKEYDVITFEDTVSMKYEGKQLEANKVVYDRTARQITAEDGVKLTGKKGNNFVAEKMIVDDELKRGTLDKVTAEMVDGSVIKSEELKILDKEKYLLKNSEYSPCKPCENGKYLWSVVADRILYDETVGKVTYRDAKIKALGHTVGWTPYLSHPTPYAKSKSGLLMPSFGRSSLYGTYLKVPYYWQPFEYMDFTFSPSYLSEDGPMLEVEHRQKFYSGDYLFRVSGVNPDEVDQNGITVAGAGKKFRGHIEGEGRFDLENLLGEYWTMDFRGKRASDDTYLQRYNLGYEDYLTSVLNVQKIEDRDLIQVSALSFQGLRLNDDPAISPLVVPNVNFAKSYKLDTKVNSKVDLLGNQLVIRRKTGDQVSRTVAGVDWNGQYLTQNGHLLSFSMLNRVDNYIIDNQPYGTGQYNGNVARYVPQAEVKWNFPLYNTMFGNGVVLEPIVMAVVSPYGQNDARIPNEDSQNAEIFDYNLFEPNHISGYDLLENGPRVNYGLRSIFNDTVIGDVSTIVGQTYRTKKEKYFTTLSGMDDYLSDYVGRVSVEGNKHLSSTYGVRVGKDDGKIARSEWTLSTNLEPVTFSSVYTFVDGGTLATDRQELGANIRYDIDQTWALKSHALRNLDNDSDSGWVNAGSGVEWKNECLTTSFEVEREFTRDRDIKPSTRFMLYLNLANLGS